MGQRLSGRTNELLRWAKNHDRVKIVIYYRGVDPDNDYNVQHFPAPDRSFAAT